jgi:hypothetical protein
VTPNSNLQRVWLILAKVSVVADNPTHLPAGSEALVQCFVPETVLEIALADCDRVLERQGLRRTDVLKCVSFEEIEADDDVPTFVKRDVRRARTSGQAFTGTFFTSANPAPSEQAGDSDSSWEN